MMAQDMRSKREKAELSAKRAEILEYMMQAEIERLENQQPLSLFDNSDGLDYLHSQKKDRIKQYVPKDHSDHKKEKLTKKEEDQLVSRLFNRSELASVWQDQSRKKRGLEKVSLDEISSQSGSLEGGGSSDYTTAACEDELQNDDSGETKRHETKYNRKSKSVNLTNQSIGGLRIGQPKRRFRL